jgi:hypothetical protein
MLSHSIFEKFWNSVIQVIAHTTPSWIGLLQPQIAEQAYAAMGGEKLAHLAVAQIF